MIEVVGVIAAVVAAAGTVAMLFITVQMPTITAFKWQPITNRVRRIWFEYATSFRGCKIKSISFPGLYCGFADSHFFAASVSPSPVAPSESRCRKFCLDVMVSDQHPQAQFGEEIAISLEITLMRWSWRLIKKYKWTELARQATDSAMMETDVSNINIPIEKVIQKKHAD